MKKLIIGIALLILGATSQQISAKPIHTPGIRHEQIREQKRIRQGFRSGELTRKEAFRLERQQSRIRHDKRCAKVDGVVTPYERAMIKTEQANASRNIYHQKHDGQHRF